MDYTRIVQQQWKNLNNYSIKRNNNINYTVKGSGAGISPVAKQGKWLLF